MSSLDVITSIPFFIPSIILYFRGNRAILINNVDFNINLYQIQMIDLVMLCISSTFHHLCSDESNCVMIPEVLLFLDLFSVLNVLCTIGSSYILDTGFNHYIYYLYRISTNILCLCLLFNNIDFYTTTLPVILVINFFIILCCHNSLFCSCCNKQTLTQRESKKLLFMLLACVFAGIGLSFHIIGSNNSAYTFYHSSSHICFFIGLIFWTLSLYKDFCLQEQQELQQINEFDDIQSAKSISKRTFESSVKS
jgi:hypothetical protein